MGELAYRPAMPPHWAPNPTRDEFRRLVLEENVRSPRELARRLGVSRDLVYRISKREELKLETDRRQPTREKLLHLVSDGRTLTISEVRRTLGVSRQRLHVIAREEGITFAPPGTTRPTCRKCGIKLKQPDGRSAKDGLCVKCRPTTVAIVCESCGAVRIRKRWDVGAKAKLCKTCWGRELGRRNRGREGSGHRK